MDFIDLKTQYQKLGPEIEAATLEVLRDGRWAGGPAVDRLEKDLASFAGTPFALGCSSGTDALLLALMQAEIGPGDAVFVPAFTFVATAEAVCLAGAEPVFVDVDPETFNLDVRELEAVLLDFHSGRLPSGRTHKLRAKAVISVDLFGLPTDYKMLAPFCKKENLLLIADSAQSLGSSLDGKSPVVWADIGCTSFFPAKALGCCGDGGAIFYSSFEEDEVFRSLRVHGQGNDRYANVRIGLNARMDSIQAAILSVKLKSFPTELEARARVADRYAALLKGKVELQKIPEGCSSAWTQYSVLANDSKDRDRCMTSLSAAKIPTAIYYRTPLHLQPAFEPLGYSKGSMRVSEMLSERVFSLPMHPWLKEEEQEEVSAALI